MVSGKTIAKNAGFMMVSQLITWTLAFIVNVFLPRYLGPKLLGDLSIASSIWSILSVLVCFGMDTYLTKVIARDPDQTSDILGLSIVVRLFFGLMACVVVGVYTVLMGFDPNILMLSYIVGVANLTGTIAGAFDAVLSGMDKMGVMSFVGVVNKALFTVLTLLFVFMKANLYAIAAISIVPALIWLVLSYRLVASTHKVKLNFNLTDSWAMLKESKQYLATSLVIIAYLQIDKLFLAMLVDTRTVGWYDTSMTLMGTLLFIPVVIGRVLFPSLSRVHSSDESKLRDLAQRGFDFMFLVGVPIGLGLAVISKPFIRLLYGAEFAESADVLVVFGFVLIFIYLNTFLGNLLIAVDRTRPWNRVMFAALILTAPLDFILVPWTHHTFGNGGLGGAIAFLFTESGMVIGAVLLLPRNILAWSNIRTAALSFLSGLLMMAASWWWRDDLMLVSIIVGAIVYCASVFLLRVISQRDLLLLRQLGMMLWGKLRPSPNVDVSG
jgi:O-antigen/teichoic acid export membrane protein